MKNRDFQLLSVSTLTKHKERITSNTSLFVLLSSMAGFAIWSILLGQDANWDFQNYHYYNAYAIFSGRLYYDIAPAQQQTYLNPALDLLPFLLIQHFPSRVFGIVMGAWQGINLWLLFLIGRELLARVSFPKPAVWAGICAVAGVRGAATASEVGTTYQDLTLSVFILGAVYLYLRGHPKLKQGTEEVSLRHLTFSGFFLGLAVGLKLTFALYGIGMGIAILVVQLVILKRYRGLLPFGLAALAGLLLVAGPWMWFLYKNYGNPFFPYYNGIFQSPYFPFTNTFDERFLPKSAWQAISFPLKFTLAEHAGSELSFRDFRIAVLYVSTFLVGAYFFISFLLSRILGSRIVGNLKCDFSVNWMLVFIWATYIVWLKIFAIYRYLICVELLAPITLVAFVGSLTHSRFSRALLLLCLIFLVFNARVPDWGRLPWTDEFFGVHPPYIQWSKKPVVLVSSAHPLAYVIPSFPESVRFIRVDGDFLNPGQNTALIDRIRSVISESVENLYLLTYSSLVNEGVLVVNQYLKGHVATAGACAPVISRIDSSIVLCRLSLPGK